MKYSLSQNSKNCKSNFNILILTSLVLSDNIFSMFIENDNLKIIKILKKLISIYERNIFTKKLMYFQKFYFKIIQLKQYQFQQFGININKQNYYNKLYNGLKIKDERLNELARKINEEEEKLYSFTPRINKSKIIFNPITNYKNNFDQMKYNSISYNKNDNDENKYKNNSVSFYKKEKKHNKNSRNFETIDLYPFNETYDNNYYNYINSFDIPYYINSKNKNNQLFSQNTKSPKPKPKNNISNAYVNSIIQEKMKNNHPIKTFSSSSISENLSLLFSSRLHIDNKKINNKNEIPQRKVKKSLFDNSSSSNINEKGTNYITEKGSRTEHLSTINHELNNSKNIKKKSSDNLYPFRNGIIPYSYSSSRKSTYFISPKSTERNNIITNRSNYFGISNYFDNSKDEKINNQGRNNKKNLSTTNAKSIKNSNINNVKSNQKNKGNILEIESNVVNENILYKNDNNSLTRKSSDTNSFHLTLQSISDSKLFDMASYYVRTDDDLERFRLFNKNNNLKRRNQNNNNVVKIYNKNNKISDSPK